MSDIELPLPAELRGETSPSWAAFQQSVAQARDEAVLAAITSSPADEAITPEQAEQLAKLTPCVHCGAIHHRACPRVRRLSYHPTGALSEVEFWPHTKWPTDGLIWPDDDQNQPDH